MKWTTELDLRWYACGESKWEGGETREKVSVATGIVLRGWFWPGQNLNAANGSERPGQRVAEAAEDNEDYGGWWRRRRAQRQGR
jgi:hypothetical protein